MRIFLPAILTLIVSGCATAPTSQNAVLDRLAAPIDAHAAALAGDDVALMRSTGRTVIAIYDAGVGTQ